MLTVVNALIWVMAHPFRIAKNNSYLRGKIEAALKTNGIMLSTFPLPDFILERYGFFRNPRFNYNFMFYTSIIHPLVRPLYRLYYRGFMRHALKHSKETYFTLGLISKGIFNAEPQYRDVSQLRKDMEFLLRNGARNVVIYSIEGISQREDPEEWVQAISEFI
ncbi:MAG TPA: hypothetical protein HA362_03510 [Nanoarchaeota archaeon]|nr:hypothetical protein [Nanoarchaeota archaeon]